MDDTVLLAEDRGATRILTMNRPASLNALSRKLGWALIEELRRADADPAVRAIILTGAGERAFCAGGDLKEPFGVGETPERRAEFIYTLFQEERRTPMIAAVNGLAFGGGLELALRCDMIIAAEHATFALPEVNRGFFASAGGVVRLPEAIGKGRAMRMALTGEPIDSGTAERWGLIVEAVPAADLMATTLAIAERISAAAPLAIQGVREILNSISYDELAWQMNDRLRLEVGLTEDAKEGPRAFSEKRAAVWQGK